MASHSTNPVRAISSGNGSHGDPKGRLNLADPVAVVDIGSNSVRLVAYEGHTRAPTPVFNEKVLCGLGRGVAKTGRLPAEGVAQALEALTRFRTLIGLMQITDVRVLATAAARDAENGQAFLARAEEAIGAKVSLISGEREAQLSALGVISGFHQPSGIVGDLGGGSLELIDVSDGEVGVGTSLKLGGLALQDASGGSLKKAQKIAKDALAEVKLKGKKRDFFAVGGTWRALSKLHMRQCAYPLKVSHGYAIPAEQALEFCRMAERISPEAFMSIEAISTARRPLLAYGAVVLEQILLATGCARVVFSASGVREGSLFDSLSLSERRLDPLLTAAAEMNLLRSRSPVHGEELAEWTDALFQSAEIDDAPGDARLRHAACLLADIGWRAHPDYRGEQSLNIIAHAAFVGVEHAERAFMALSIFYRHEGLGEEVEQPPLRELATIRLQDRARLLGGAMRVAYNLTAAMPGVLPRSPLVVDGRKLRLTLPRALVMLHTDRLMNRMKQLGRMLGREAVIEIGA